MRLNFNVKFISDWYKIQVVMSNTVVGVIGVNHVTYTEYRN